MSSPPIAARTARVPRSTATVTMPAFWSTEKTRPTQANQFSAPTGATWRTRTSEAVKTGAPGSLRSARPTIVTTSPAVRSAVVAELHLRCVATKILALGGQVDGDVLAERAGQSPRAVADGDDERIRLQVDRRDGALAEEPVAGRRLPHHGRADGVDERGRIAGVDGAAGGDQFALGYAGESDRGLDAPRVGRKGAAGGDGQLEALADRPLQGDGSVSDGDRDRAGRRVDGLDRADDTRSSERPRRSSGRESPAPGSPVACDARPRASTHTTSGRSDRLTSFIWYLRRAAARAAPALTCLRELSARRGRAITKGDEQASSGQTAASVRPASWSGRHHVGAAVPERPDGAAPPAQLEDELPWLAVGAGVEVELETGLVERRSRRAPARWSRDVGPRAG